MSKEWNIDSIQAYFREYGYTLLTDRYTNNKQKLKCEKDGYLYEIMWEHFMRGIRPHMFSQFNPYTIQNIHTYIKTNKIKSVLISDKYVDKKDKLAFRCICGDIYECSLWNFIKKQYKGCPKCNISKRVESTRYSFNAINKVAIENGYRFVDAARYSVKDRYPFIDSNGYIVITSIDAMKRGIGANIFDVSNPYTIQNIKKFILLNKLNCKVVSKIYSGKEGRLDLCCACGNVYTTTWQKFSYHKQDRCSVCTKSMSNIEFIVGKYLDKLGIEYEKQKAFDGCRYKNRLLFDFYIPKANLCIEVNGEQHYRGNTYFNKYTGLKYQKIRDNIKIEYCKNNNIGLLEIPYYNIPDNTYKEMINNKLYLSK